MGKSVRTLELRLYVELDEGGRPTAWYAIGYDDAHRNEWWDDDGAVEHVRQKHIVQGVSQWLLHCVFGRHSLVVS